MRKSDQFTHSINTWKDKHGIINFKIVSYDEAENSLLSFTTYLTARERIDAWIQEHELCMRYCSLVSEEAVCFNHQIKKCKGICAGDEKIDLYNERAVKIINEYSFKDENFILIDKGRRVDEKSIILIEDRKYAGHGYIDQTTQVNSLEEIRDLVKCKNYCPDMNDLVRGWLKNKNVTKIILEKSIE